MDAISIIGISFTIYLAVGIIIGYRTFVDNEDTRKSNPLLESKQFTIFMIFLCGVIWFPVWVVELSTAILKKGV